MFETGKLGSQGKYDDQNTYELDGPASRRHAGTELACSLQEGVKLIGEYLWVYGAKVGFRVHEEAIREKAQSFSRRRGKEARSQVGKETIGAVDDGMSE